MAFHRLDNILGDFGQDNTWQEQRLFQLLLQRWESLVGKTVATHTRPTGIHREVLQVATSEAVWAQNLSFERRRILQKIQRMERLRSLQLRDIRFSTAEWHNRPIEPEQRLNSQEQQQLWQKHPSRLTRSQAFTECPMCKCPTPPGELKRWPACAFCMAQQWRIEQIANQYRPLTEDPLTEEQAMGTQGSNIRN